MLIDLVYLTHLGLLEQDDLREMASLGEGPVDFALQREKRPVVLRKAYINFKKKKDFREYGSFETFCREQEEWLRPYALFAALRDLNQNKAWQEWPEEMHTCASAQRLLAQPDVAERMEAQQFYQYLFWGQWQRLRGYAIGRGVRLIGDMPFYVGGDGAEVWANPELFVLDEKGSGKFVGGVPPDYYSATGQKWGNPIYDWELHKKTQYRWWVRNFKHQFDLFDVIRLDHFRGFYDYWKIPANAPDGRTGEWCLGPGKALFEAVTAWLPQAKFIAEDLGWLSDGATKFVKETGLPNMTVMTFGFGADAKNPHLMHNARHNQVAYAAMHDNDTLQGWIAESAKEHEREHALRYLDCGAENFRQKALRTVFAGVPSLAIVQAQDLLGLPSSARMNVPGTPQGNWRWRMTNEQMQRLNAGELRNLLGLYGRA